MELDVSSEESVNSAADRVLSEVDRLDVMMHNAGHMVTGPSEAFTPDQCARLYDTNVLGAQRLNRALLPHMRARQHGLVLWTGSTSTRGGTPPYLGPYFAAKAAMDALAVTYASELARFNIETTIIVPGSFTRGTNHYAHTGHPADAEIAISDDGVFPGLMEPIGQRMDELLPADADVGAVADAVVRVVAMSPGRRPFRVHIDPADDGAAVVNAVADHIRAWFLGRIGLVFRPDPWRREAQPGRRCIARGSTANASMTRSRTQRCARCCAPRRARWPARPAARRA